MHKSQLSLLLILFLNFFIAEGQEVDSLIQVADTIVIEDPVKTFESKVDSVVQQAIQNNAFPGCVIYASYQDSIIFHKSYGFHTYDSLIDVKKDNIYDLASVTKVMGATLAMMKLYEDSLIHLDAPIGDYVEKVGKKVGRVTIRQALAHQGGLYPWIPFHLEMRKKDGSFKSKSVSNIQSEEFPYALSDSLYLHRDFYRQIKKLIKKSTVAKEPTYRYSGLFFYLIPEMVKNLTGMEYEEYLKENFYNQLSAETLTFNPLAKFPLAEIAPTEVDTFFRMEPIHGKVHDEGAIMMKGVSGNAGLFGNAKDVAKVWKMWLNQGITDTIRFLSPQTIDLFTTTHYPNLDNRRGLGFDKPLLEYDAVRSSVAKDASHRSYGHSGYTGTLVWADPENELLFIFLSNRVYPTRKNSALYRLNVRPTIHQLIYDYLKAKDLENSPPVESAK